MERQVFAGTVPPPHDRVVPGPGQESVWDYPRPPRVESVPERIRIVVDGITLAVDVAMYGLFKALDYYEVQQEPPVSPLASPPAPVTGATLAMMRST